MKFPHFFIDRPIFATVLSTLIVLVGGIAYFQLPVGQYPEVALPTVTVRASYPGATAETISKTVATPLEQEINGVENMLYLDSQGTADGSLTITATFALGTDVDQAQVLVQNRVAVALPRLPDVVRQIGVTTRKSSPDLMLVIHLFSPDDSRDQLYIGNYAYLQIKDILARQDGVGDIVVFGGTEYSMRIWLDVDRLAALDMTPGDAVEAMRSQNVQVAAGIIGQQPLEEPKGGFQVNVNTLGRLQSAEEFGEIILKSGENGRIVRLADVARIELGAVDYSVRSYLQDKNAVALAMFQRPGSNAIETTDKILEAMKELRKSFPPGLEYNVIYNPTAFVEQSIEEVFTTLWQAGLLVVLTVFVFLQNWRSTIVPVIAIPISLIGTFAVMQGIGFSLNNLSLFGLVLAIGIVVDDAIVVVENVERLISEGLEPREATRKAMDEVGTALIATTLVLIAVFVPTAFIAGISGQFYRQFAITIAVSTAISTFVSLTLTPAMCALLLRPQGAKKNWFGRMIELVLGWPFRIFNRVFDVSSVLYSRIVGRVIRMGAIMLLIYGGLLGLTYYGFTLVPGGFIPAQDQGYLIVAIQTPPGASLDRTDAVTRKVVDMALEIDGVENAVSFVGFSGATRANSSNAAAIFPVLKDAKERAKRGRSLDVILNELRQKVSAIDDSLVFVIQPPPVRGIGTGGGFKMQVQDRSGAGLVALQEVTNNLVDAARKEPGLVQVFSNFNIGTPQIYADVDRTKVRMLDVPMNNVFEALQIYLGSAYVNDFNFLGRTYRVTAQADAQYRDEESDIMRLRTRSNNGSIVPLGSMVTMRTTTAPDRVVRYNLFPAADVNGDTVPGFSSGQSIQTMERLAEEVLPRGFGYEWTDIAFQQKEAGNTAIYIFPLCVFFVFLALAAQYESWLLPLAVILIVPMCLLCAIFGVWFRGMDNNILTQIGLVVLVGLACKNAILIVEFAKAEEDAGKDRFQAAIDACRLRLRPILMTAFSFILGVIPLVIATGAGSEMRQALGTAVFSGMLGVTLFGLFLTPVFYVLLRKLAKDTRPEPTATTPEGITVAMDQPASLPVAPKENRSDKSEASTSYTENPTKPEDNSDDDGDEKSEE
ncbi:Efflux pump membrane transporter BepE [Polystyrenella longa]|uniref:Efflux pump membrane transporter BepE n=1 Tax=Polystyrenella longa TaxID=2528007 RepID=A0A518CMT0_9PLAN|nr:multidrug efflux RND transporter permease subunit [Polystyrenella longa]QDU80532.1 Efflux pump membrane transporter BepE [Polystyrenella longa]